MTLKSAPNDREVPTVTLPYRCDPGMTARDGTGYCGSVLTDLAVEAGPELTGSLLHLLYQVSGASSAAVSPCLTPDPAWATLLLPTFFYQVLLHSIY